MREIILFSLIIVMFLAGCEGLDVSQLSDEDLSRIADQAIVCEKPYVRHGTGCCLDQDENNICDEDEIAVEKPKEKTIEKQKHESKEEIKYEEKKKEEYMPKDKGKLPPDVPEGEKCQDEVYLKAEVVDDHVILEWDAYKCPDFKGYKISWSNMEEWPKYPEQGYINYITDMHNTQFRDKVRGKKSHYSITVLTFNDKIYTAPVTVEAPDHEGPEEIR